jgi:hypothetical protein
MKRLEIILILSLAVTAAGRAQQNAGLEFSAGTGYAFSVSPMAFADYWKVQAGGEVSAGIALSPSFVLAGAVEYYRFTMDNAGIQKSFDTKYMKDIWIVDAVSMNPAAEPSSILTLSANIRMMPPELTGLLRPYFIAGTGVMFSTLSDVKIPTTSVLSLDGSTVSMTAQRRIIGGKETTAFIQGGIGLDAGVSDMLGFFAEARFAFALSKNAGMAFVPLNVGVRYRI